jgi:hypothetical protein
MYTTMEKDPKERRNGDRGFYSLHGIFYFTKKFYPKRVYFQEDVGSFRESGTQLQSK